ncbi:hypothetical protein DVH05_004651 [Phytophthora capsici]|nr:hypothetical protein DVH05_004651 [Phytophthora capsici]|eukprot:jgi/Phyca11/21937/fgenesh1_pg.PHYCAscaffold_242_\
MQTIFHWQGLLQLVQGREEFDQARADRSQEWKNCFETRERKAHTEIVLSLHSDLFDRFKSYIESARPAQPWTALLRTYDGTQGTNSVYLKQVNIYPPIANEHTLRVSRLRGGYDKGQRVEDAVNLLLVAERTAQKQKDRGNRNDGQGVQRQVIAVNQHEGGNRQQHSDFEERLLRARDAQRENESIEYSLTSPPDDADEDERGASGLPVVRRVLAATTNGGTGVVPADEIE